MPPNRKESAPIDSVTAERRAGTPAIHGQVRGEACTCRDHRTGSPRVEHEVDQPPLDLRVNPHDGTARIIVGLDAQWHPGHQFTPKIGSIE
jgi:hypothetical protein